MGMFDDLIPKDKQEPVGTGMFDDLIPKKPTSSVQTVTSTPSPARPTPQQIERMADASVTSPITGEGGAAFGIYPRAVPKKPTPTVTTTEAKPAAAEQPTPYTPRDFSALDKAIDAITPKAAPSVTTPIEGEMGAAFGMYPKQKMGGRTTGIKTEAAAQTPEVTSFIAEYMKERRPNLPLAKDPVKLIEDFKDMMSKNTMDNIRELTFVANASPKQKDLTIKAYDLAQKMDTNVNDTVVREVLDPFNWVGAGAGFAYKQAALRTAQSMAKIQLKTVGVTAATEGAVAGVQSTIQQKIDISLGLQDEFSYAALAASVGLSAVIEGVAGGKAATTIGGARKTSERIAELRTTKAVDIDAKNDEWMTKFLAKEKEVVEGPTPLYPSAEARQQAREESINVIDAPTDITESVLNKPIITDIFKVAKQYFKDNPDARPDLNQVRVTQAIVDALSTADVDAIQQAASRAGVKPAEFLEAFKVQASEAGAYLQQASALGRFLRNMTEGDPDLEDAFKKMFNAGSGVSYWTGRVVEGVKKGTGASVAASTAGLSTAVLNAIGLTGTVGIQVAGDILESAVRVGGRMINDLRGDGPPVNAARVKEDIGEIFADGGFLLSRMVDAGYTRELSELAIKNNPRLNNLINNMSVEADLTGANELLQTINIFNRAVDGVVRRPILMQSIKNRMKDVGLDYEEYLASDKPIPASLIKAAVDDTMKLTFSYNFKKTGEKSIEGFAEDAAFKVLQTINQNAGAGVLKDLVTPFIRFQLNAVRYTYRMTPLSGWGGIQELEKAAKLRGEGKIAEAAGLAYDGKRKVLDSVVGTAAITAAAVYRQENADTQFYQVKDKDGNIIDASGVFPYSNIMAMGEMLNVMADLGKELWYTAKMTPEERAKEADAILKQAESLDVNDPARQRLINQYELLGLSRVRNFDGAKFGEVIAGLGRMAGVQQSVFNTVAEAIEGGITESAERKAGGLVGDFVSRFDNVLNPVYDAINFMIGDMRVVDPKASTTLSGKVSPGVEAAIGPVVAPVPGARNILQDKPSLFQEEQVQVPSVVRQFTGIRPTAPTTPVENELIRLNIQPYTIFKTSGNRDYDNIRIAFARPIFLGGTTQLIEQDEEYRKLSANEQQVAIKTRIGEAFNETKEMARDYFIQTKGESAVDALYQKATNKQAQEDRFVKLFKRKPQSPAEKMMIVDGDFDVAKEAGKLNNGGFVTQKYSPNFAIGGIVAKSLLKKAGKKTTAVAADVLGEVGTAATKAAPTPAPAGAIGQMADILSGAPAPVAPVKKPSKKAAKKPLEVQTEEAIPTPAPKEEIAPEPSMAVETPTVAPTFTAEDYKLGEALMLESGYTPDMMQKMKKADYNSYMNEVHLFTGTAKGIKYKDIPPSPFLKKNEVTDAIEYDIEGNEISVNGVPVQPSTGASEMIDDAFEDVFVPEVDTTKLVKGAQAGDVEQSVDWIDPEDSTLSAQRKYVNQRNKVLSDIKNIRKSEFSKMRKDPSFDSYDDEVLAVLQGDFRKKFDREFDVATDKEAGIVMATRYQKKLDELREMYKDVPPKKLWHGNVSEKIEPVKKKGFADPQTRKNFHEELYVGAPSFTSDLNLNMTAEAFGGMNPSNILYTEIPYAEYVFTRINMKPEAYDVKDLSTIAQAINGSPNVARAVSLPRAGYFEKESMMPEANKLRLRSAAKDVEAAIGAGGVNPDLAKETAKTLDRVVKSAIKNNSVTDAYTAYGGIRDLMKQIESMSGNVSVKGGRGHQVAATLNNIAGDADKMKQYIKIADILDQNGAKQKAETLREFIKSLNSYGSSYGGRAAEEVERIPKLKSVFDSANKLAKGGFVSKRR